MSSFRGLNKKIVNKITSFKGPDVYIDGLIIKFTKDIGMITVVPCSEKGESNYDLRRLLILWSNMVINFLFILLECLQFLE